MSSFSHPVTDVNPFDEKKASEWLSTLYVINDMLRQVEADGLQIDTILPRVLDVAVRQLDAQEGSIIVVNLRLEVEHVWLARSRTKPFREDVLGGEVAGWVIRHRQPAIIDDTCEDERWLNLDESPVETDPWSVISSPFLVRDRAIGAITIQKPGARQFDESDLNLLATISNQAATTVENARLYEESQRQLQISALLNKASHVINSSLDINKIMQSLLAQMNEFLNAEAISIALVDKSTNELVYQVAEGIGSDKIVNLRLPSSLGISGWVMEHAEPVLVPDTTVDPRFHSLGDQRTGHKTRAMICAPVQFQQVVLGTIQAINPIQGSFTAEDLNLLVNLANIASSAVANAQQFARTQAAEERYTSLFQGSIDPIILTDTGGRIVEANNRALELLGYEREKLFGMNIRELHPANSDLPDLDEVSADAPTTFSGIIRNSRGEQTHVEVNAKRTTFGDSELLQWIHHDISKQIELEEMREDLTAMLFHDLQSPLGNVIASLELLIDEAPSSLGPAYHGMLDIAMRSSRRLEALVKSLLDINQLEAGHPISEQTEVQLANLIDDVQDITRPSFDRLGIRIIRKIDADLPRVYVEEDMIRRVLVNIVDNALRYGEGSEEITIRATSFQKGSDMILVSIRDQGVGIPEKYHGTIFDKFQRVGTDMTSGGIGLGLAFCRLAVEAHGGCIWVENAPGGGAEFSFTLPAVRDDS